MEILNRPKYWGKVEKCIKKEGRMATGSAKEKCTKQFVLIAAPKPRYHSNPHKEDLFIAGNASESAGPDIERN